MSELNHIAVDVENVKEFIETMVGSGWYLHPFSMKTIDTIKQAWLARPGESFLVEINQAAHQFANNFISKAKLTLSASDKPLLKSLDCKSLEASQEVSLFINDKEVILKSQHFGLCT